MAEGNEGAPPEPISKRDKLIKLLQEIRESIDNNKSWANGPDISRHVSSTAYYGDIVAEILELNKEKLLPNPGRNILCVCVGDGVAELEVANTLQEKLTIEGEIANKPNVTLVDKKVADETELEFTEKGYSLTVFDRKRTGNPEYGLAHFFIDALKEGHRYDSFVMLGAEYLFGNQHFKTMLPDVLSELLEEGGVVCITPHKYKTIKDWEGFNFIYQTKNEDMPAMILVQKLG